MLRSLRVKSLLILLLVLCIFWQIHATIAQSAGTTRDQPTLRKHEEMCQQYKSKIYEKVYTFGPLAHDGSQRKLVVDTCAPSTPFIVGGTPAKPKEFPHMARLGSLSDDGVNTNWFCGGTLISKSFVLTAAHCFFHSEIVNRVRLGDLIFDSNDDDARPKDYIVKDYYPHPNYTNSLDYHDVGLVELNEEVIFSHYVAPACLPKRNGDEYERFLAVGWGSVGFYEAGSNHLLKVTLNRYDGSRCNMYASRTSTLPRGLVEAEQLCAGSDRRRDTCTGDSGGPLLQYSNIKCMYQVVGVTSTGAGCAIANVPGIYARVYDYIDWIEGMVWD